MTKLKLISVTTLAIAGVAASLMILHKSQARIHEGDALLRRQEQQLAELTAEHQRLSNLVAATNSASAVDHTAELAKLHHQAEALRKQTNELGKRSPSQPARTTVSQETHTPEYWQQLHQLGGAKGSDALQLASCFFEYASDHNGQVPSNFSQIASYLAKEDRSLSGTNQFDIVYQGSLDKLKGLPLGEVALVRDQQAWQTPDGKMARVYGMNNGTSQIVMSDDNFQSWEAEHIIPPSGAGKSSP